MSYFFMDIRCFLIAFLLFFFFFPGHLRGIGYCLTALSDTGKAGWMHFMLVISLTGSERNFSKEHWQLKHNQLLLQRNAVMSQNAGRGHCWANMKPTESDELFKNNLFWYPKIRARMIFMMSVQGSFKISIYLHFSLTYSFWSKVSVD